MFVRNKIPRYSSCPTPSPSAAPKATHTAEPVVPFYLRKVSTPSASTLHTSSPSQSHHCHAKPPSTRPVTYPRTPPTKRRTAVMAAVTESIKVVLMRLNCRRYCRPPPPPRPLLHPFFADLPVTPFNPPIPHLVYRVYLLSLSLFPRGGYSSPVPVWWIFLLSPAHAAFRCVLLLCLEKEFSFPDRPFFLSLMDAVLFYRAHRRLFPSLSRYRARVDSFFPLHFAPWSFVSVPHASSGFGRSSSVLLITRWFCIAVFSYYSGSPHDNFSCTYILYTFFSLNTAFRSMCVYTDGDFFSLGLNIIGWGVGILNFDGRQFREVVMGNRVYIRLCCWKMWINFRANRNFNLIRETVDFLPTEGSFIKPFYAHFS